jgi:ferrous iron transport protein A
MPFDTSITPDRVTLLSQARKGDRGVVARVEPDAAHSDGDIERRLIEMGLVEGARIEVLHEGLIGRDPIVLKVDDMRVALRRREAACIAIEPLG